MNSICGNCGGFRWELSEEAPDKSRFNIWFIRCAACKVPVGVADYYDTHSELAKIEKNIKILGDSVTQILQVVHENIRRLFQK
jgi:hypothetical protein